MTRADFIKTMGGIFGVAIVAPVVIAEVTKSYPDDMHSITGRADGAKFIPLQEYSSKDWSGLTSRNHLGSLIEQMKPLQKQHNINMMKFLSKFDR